MTDIDNTIARYLPAAQLGNREAFTELVKSTQTTVASIALAIVRDVQVSEDIAQEAYLRVWRRLPELRKPMSFLPWLRQVTRNLSRDHLRRAKARPGDRTDNDSDDELAALLDTAPGADAQLIADEESRALQQAFDALPAEAREIITLYYREGRSSHQLAHLLGVSEPCLRQRLTRARQRLRQGLEPHVESALVRSIPSAGFTAAVGTLLATAAPPPAAAAAAAALGAKTSLKALALGGLGFLLGGAAGIAGVILGLRPALKTSTDDEERRALMRQQRLGVLYVLLTMLGFALTSYTDSWIPQVLIYLSLIAALTWQTQVAVPRILAPRFAAQRAANAKAAKAQALGRRLGLVGLIGGSLAGLTGLIVGLVSSGRLG